jgi:hypothetical protein
MYLDLIEKKRKKKELNTILNPEKIRKFKPIKMNSSEIQKILQEFINDLDIKNSFYPFLNIFPSHRYLLCCLR